MTPVRSLRAALPLFAAAFLLTASVASAQGGLKVGVFDKQRIVDESILGKGVKDRFEKQQADREAEIDAKQKAFDAAQKAYEQQAAVLSDEKRLEKQRDLARQRDELQSDMSNADRDLQRAYQQALVELVQKLDPVINDFAKTGGYDFLFDQQQFAYAKDGYDVTDLIIAKVNGAFPSAAGGTAAPKP